MSEKRETRFDWRDLDKIGKSFDKQFKTVGTSFEKQFQKTRREWRRFGKGLDEDYARLGGKRTRKKRVRR